MPRRNAQLAMTDRVSRCHRPSPQNTRWRLVVPLLLCALSAAAEDGATATYELGLAQMQQGDTFAAIGQFQQVVQQDPNHLPARIALGTARLNQGDAAGAEKELRLALSLGAARHAVFPLLGNALLAQRQYTVLLDTIDTASGERRGNFEVELLRGRAQFELGQHELAAQNFERAAALAPERAEPLLGQALVAAAQSRNDSALALIEDALRLAPSDVEAWFRKGEVLREQGDDSAALAAYEHAVQLDANALRVRLARASVLFKRGARQAALADVEWVQHKRPNDLSAAFLRWQILHKDHDAGSNAALAEVSGTLSQYADQTIEAEPQLLRIAALVHYANGDRVRADKYLARYVEQRPNDIAMRRLHAEVLLALGEAKQAAAVLAPLARQDPRNLDLLRSVGQAYLQSGQYSEAEAAFARLLTLAPADHAALTTLALARLGVGNVDGAQIGLAEAVADAEVGRGAPMLLTVLQLKAGDGERALATIEALLEKYGQDARVLNLLGVVRASLGDQTGARAAFAAALLHAPDFTPPSYNLARLSLAAGDIDSARARLQSLASRQPPAAAALTALADIALAEDDRAGAAQWLEQAVAAQPDALAPVAQLVDLKLALGQLDEALAIASRLAERHPERALAVEALAAAQAARGRTDQALRHYRDAARYAGFDGEQLMRIATRQAQLEDFEQAQQTLRKALNSSASAQARDALIRLAIQRGDYRGADEAIATLREDASGRALADIMSGELELHRGDATAAAKAYRAAQAAMPSSLGALGLADALVAGGRPAEAADTLELWSARHAEDIDARQALALLYLRLNKLREARSLHEQLIEALPGDAQLQANLARLYQLDGDPRARKTAERALRLAPDSALAQDTLGWIIVTSGDAEGGLELLRNALSRDGNPLTRYHLAQALHELGRGAEARRELRRLLKGTQSTELLADVQRYYDALPAQ